MADKATLTRLGPLEGQIAGAAGVAIAPSGPAFRTVLRAHRDALSDIGSALEVVLPQKPKSSATNKNGRIALWLGPDEWLIIDEKADPMTSLTTCKALFSVVDVSHRNTAIKIAGRGARATLEAGCPQDLSDVAFPVGAGSRTVLGKVEVVILRTGPNAYRVECWRSFADYAFRFLADAAKDCLA